MSNTGGGGCIINIVETIIYFFVFVLGGLVGSFLNVITLRYGGERGVVYERSSCPSCKKILGPMELIPVFSFVLQKGRCRSCRAKISWQYPIVEILTGLVFISVFLKLMPDLTLFFSDFSGIIASIDTLLFYWVIFSILIAISIYDFHHKIIPDEFVFTFIAFSFFGIFLFHPGLSQMFQALIAGPLIASPFLLIWFFSGGRAMGFGDVKLAFGIGFFLGLVSAIYALVWAFWIGGAFSITILILKKIFSAKRSLKSKLFSSFKGITIKSEIPFGPFLVLGTFIAFLFEWDFMGLDFIFSIFFNS